jgi:hypothetical protein
MDVKAFTGPITESVSNPRINDRNVRAVQHIADRKHSDTPTPSSSDSSVSLEVRNHPLQLLLRVVIEKLNETLPHNSEHEVFKGVSDLELSPELTAGHIVAHASVLYGPYKLTHSEKQEVVNYQDFIDNVVKGIELGFDEAQEILQNLGVLHGEIEHNVDITFALVQKGLLDFRHSKNI